jgi:hypothetical protein
MKEYFHLFFIRVDCSFRKKPTKQILGIKKQGENSVDMILKIC